MTSTLRGLALALAAMLPPTAGAAVLTCTAAAPCRLSDVLNNGQVIEARQLVTDIVLGPRWETMRYAGFSALGGDFGGSRVQVWTEVSGRDWSLVMAPAPGVPNPWRIDTPSADAGWSGTLTYDLEFDGLRVDVRGRAVPSHLSEAALLVQYGQFRNVGGLSLTGEVDAELSAAPGAAPAPSPLNLTVGCGQLQVSVNLGCDHLGGSASTPLDNLATALGGHDRLVVENRIALDYRASTGGGGTLEVLGLTNRFTEAPVVDEPAGLALSLLALAGAAGARRRARGRQRTPGASVAG